VDGAPATGSSGSTGALGDERMLYREPVRELAAAADGTDEDWANGKAGTLEPAVPGGIVRQSCAASRHRGDRGLHSASKANGKPLPNHKSQIPRASVPL